MDRLVDHLFIFEGEGKIKDYNGNYTEYRELKKIEDREQKKQSANGNGQSANTPSVSPVIDARKANDTERKEFKRLEKEIEKLEQQKAEITDKFNDSNISNKDIEKLSLELSGVLKQLEIKEMRWLELSELV
jgi:ABC transport system ATP-binding/permease protein